MGVKAGTDFLRSFRFSTRSLSGGGVLGVTLEALEDPSEAVGKTLRFEVWEQDLGVDEGKGAKKSDDDHLATFTARVAESKPMEYRETYYFFEDVKRVDAYEHRLPGPERGRKLSATVKGKPQSWTLKAEPHYVPAHFELAFEDGTPTRGGYHLGKGHTVLFRGQERERERMVYEVGVDVYYEDTLLALLRDARVDCNNLLVQNLVTAAETFLADQLDMLEQRGIGTHYGSRLQGRLQAVIDNTKGRYSAAQVKQAREAKQRLKEDVRTYGLEKGSCIGYALMTLELGYRKTRASADWKWIRGFMSKGRGTTLAQGFEASGWTGIYYNRDVDHPEDGDSWHRKRGKATLKGKSFFGCELSESIVDYLPTTELEDGTTIAPAKRTKLDKASKARLDELLKVPWALLNGRAGSHVAMLISGTVYEIHWTGLPWRDYPSPRNKYEVFDDRKGFVPDPKDPDAPTWGFLSGCVHVPPGFWTLPKAKAKAP